MTGAGTPRAAHLGGTGVRSVRLRTESLDAVCRSIRVGSFFVSYDETAVALLPLPRGLQFTFQRDREFSNSAPDFFRIYGGEP